MVQITYLNSIILRPNLQIKPDGTRLLAKCWGELGVCGSSSPLDSPPADLYSGLLVRTVLRNCAGGVLATEDSAHERGCSIVWTTSGSCPRSARLSYTTLLLSESAEAPCVLFSINCRGVLAPREEQLTESTDVQKRGADAVRAELLVQHMCVAQPTT